jgi:hypothetical protein
MAPRGEPKLTEQARAFVVQCLAMFDAPSVVAAAVRKEFNLTITPQSVEAYDPTKRAGAKLSVKWRALFDETRKTFLEDTARIGISHRTVRLRALQRMADRAETSGNIVVAAQLHKQAAEEMGNAYTNKRELTGKDGKDLPAVGAVTIFSLPDNGRG